MLSPPLKQIGTIILASLLVGCAHTAQVQGIVHFQEGPPIPGVEVHLYDGFAGLLSMHEIKKGTTVTDKYGRFRFDNIRYSHTLGVRVFGKDCQWWGGNRPIMERDTTPPEEYSIDIPLLPDECKISHGTSPAHL